MLNWWGGGPWAECCKCPHVPPRSRACLPSSLPAPSTTSRLIFPASDFADQFPVLGPPPTEASLSTCLLPSPSPWRTQEVFAEFHLMSRIWQATGWIYLSMTRKRNGDDLPSGTYFICRSTFILHPSLLVIDGTCESKNFFVSKPTYSDSIISPCHI